MIILFSHLDLRSNCSSTVALCTFVQINAASVQQATQWHTLLPNWYKTSPARSDGQTIVTDRLFKCEKYTGQWSLKLMAYLCYTFWWQGWLGRSHLQKCNMLHWWEASKWVWKCPNMGIFRLSCRTNLINYLHNNYNCSSFKAEVLWNCTSIITLLYG